MLEKPRKGQSYEVVELEKASLGLIARLLHRHLLDCKIPSERETTQITIFHLANQTSVVSSDPEKHLPKSLLENTPPLATSIEIVERR